MGWIPPGQQALNPVLEQKDYTDAIAESVPLSCT